MAEHQAVKDARDLTPQVWFAAARSSARNGSRNPATINSDLTELRHFVQFLYGLERAVCEKFLLVEPLDIGFRMPKDVALGDLRKLQAAIQAEAGRLGIMDLAWFLLMLAAGVATCEVRHLKLSDINGTNDD